MTCTWNGRSTISSDLNPSLAKAIAHIYPWVLLTEEICLHIKWSNQVNCPIPKEISFHYINEEPG